MLVISIFIVIAIVIFLVYGFIPSYLNKKKFFRRIKSQKKVIYLTFDDGPSQHTDELLNVLRKYNIKATFFCVASFARERRDIIEKMKKDGHIIGLHSLKHKNAMLQDVYETKKDLSKSLMIMKALGVDIKYYRPPWGDSNLYLIKKLKKENLKLILWDVMAEDWKKKATKEIIANKLLSRVEEEDIICLHDRKRKK